MQGMPVPNLCTLASLFISHIILHRFTRLDMAKKSMHWLLYLPHYSGETQSFMTTCFAKKP